jgi:cysteine desulfurase
MDRRVYFDHAATTKMRKEVLAEMMPYFDINFGNASSLHREGQKAREAVEKARLQLASLIGAKPEEIYFTSGGTESDNMAIKATTLISKKKHIITTPIEHHAVLYTAKNMERLGYQVTLLPVDSKGTVSPEDVKKAITPDTHMVSVMLANNEIGTLQPIAEISKITREKGVLLHTDAVQVVGNYPLDVGILGCDMLSLSAHKFYGPKGVGAIYIRKGTPIVAFMDGGEHEHGKRSGTYNTPGIVGLGKAAQLASLELPDRVRKVSALRDRLIQGIQKGVPEVILNGSTTDRLPGNVHFSIRYVEGESLLFRLDDEGFAVSTGSACSSHSLKISHVLQAIGLDVVDAQGSLRLSLGYDNNEEEIDQFLAIFPGVVAGLREISPLYKKGN